MAPSFLVQPPLASGARPTFTIMPDAGYHIASITANGTACRDHDFW